MQITMGFRLDGEFVLLPGMEEGKSASLNGSIAQSFSNRLHKPARMRLQRTLRMPRVTSM